MHLLLFMQDGPPEAADAVAKARTDPILLGVIVALVAAAAVGSAFLMTRHADNDSPETTRLKWGAAITAVAFVAIVAVFCMAVWMFDSANDVVATVGVITGLMGTVIGTFFGVQVGSAGTQTATTAALQAARAADQAAESAGRAVQEATAARAARPAP
jgi:uncharacterized BrkB/YihY/UPF0761 family membrane protein